MTDNDIIKKLVGVWSATWNEGRISYRLTIRANGIFQITKSTEYAYEKLEEIFTGGSFEGMWRLADEIFYAHFKKSPDSGFNFRIPFTRLKMPLMDIHLKAVDLIYSPGLKVKFLNNDEMELGSEESPGGWQHMLWGHWKRIASK